MRAAFYKEKWQRRVTLNMPKGLYGSLIAGSLNMYGPGNFSVTKSAAASMNRRFCRLAVVFLTAYGMVAGATEPAPGDWQATGEITAAAEKFVRQNSGNSGDRLVVTAGYLDPRLMLARCTETIEPFVNAGTQLSGRIIVGVRCTGEKPWKVYLPVHVGVMEEMIVTARSLARDHIVGPDDIVSEYRDVSKQVGSYIRLPEEAIGRRILRPLARGVALQSSLLHEQTLIEKGQRVTINVKSESISIQMAGIAESSGIVDELIEVRNLGSGKIIEGRVRSRTIVEVAMN